MEIEAVGLPAWFSVCAFWTAAILTVGIGLAANEAPISPGEQIFNSRCAGCHGLDGRGGEHGPNIAINPRVQALSDSDILQIVREGKPAAGMPPFGSTLKELQLKAVVARLRILQGKREEVLPRGNVENGHALFWRKGYCSECHMMNGRGGFIGPDLSSYGATHSFDEIRQIIVDPNKITEEHEPAVLVTTREGATYKGIARNEDNFSLQLQTIEGRLCLFDKRSLSKVEHLTESLMPQYGTVLSAGELDDLATYVVIAGNRH